MRVAILAALLCVTCGRKAEPVESTGLPGAEPRDAATERQLSEALARRGAWYKPHTRHLRSDGSPRFTNRLILEKSPYLVAHAHNPVDWYAWGDAAFAAAAAANKPVLLSIGYSTCHWCHVMADESFEDEGIASTINRYFIAIKVDREERPDLDAVYMEAVQKFGEGGWPMTVFLLPDRRPFFGTTYLPPRDHMRGNAVGLATLLDKIHDAYTGDRAKLTEQAQMVAASLAAREPTRTAMPGFGALREQVQQLTAAYDGVWGGFGPAPKFPRPAAIDLLLRFYRHTGDMGVLDMAAHTLDRIAAGGIRDHVGGGFHRYSTDAHWRVPHFEKMLYDNAQLVVVYLATFQLLSRPQDGAVARDTLDYLLRDMRSPDGGFYAASDADSDGDEGTYFTWTAAEIDRAIGRSARIVREVFDVTVGGNWQRGRNVLWRPQTDAQVADRLGISVDDVRATIATARDQLAAARAKRPAPAIDRKILVGWNALAITAFARAALVLDDQRYKDAAITCANLLLDRAKGAHELVDGKPSGTAFLDDTALLEAALLDLYEADPDPRWLRSATELQDTLDRNFGTTGPYSFTPANHEKLLAPVRANLDDPIPSGNAVAAQNLMRLHQLLDEERYRTRANQILPTLTNPAAIDFAIDRPKQIVIVGDPTEMLAKLRKVYVPNRVIVQVTDGKPSPSPLAEGKTMRGGKPTAYVCIGTRCELPTTDTSVFASQLMMTEPLP